MDRLSDAPELLDGPLPDSAVVAGNLRDLRRINRLFGGVALSDWGVRRLLDVADSSNGSTGPATILDVGTGGADIPLALLAAARREDRALRVHAVDSRTEILDAASVARPGFDRVDGLWLEVVGEAALPYPDGSFDVAHASLVVHHLEPDQAVAFIRELGRVGRRGVVVNDVSRGWLAWAGAWLFGHLLTTNRFTRHDATLSVRRAYTLPEMRALFVRAGLRPIDTRRRLLGQRYAIVAVPASSSVEDDGDSGSPR
jgi:ubiquinone/menaquinone biosynthesis C-methylase UbiE